nr:nitroreductase family protein [uncultured Acetatifactor sp.]
MELSEAIQKRHSVRSYEERAIEKNTRDQLLSFIDQCNQESGLHMQLVLDEPKGFDGFMAHYGKFSGVKNYIAVIGKKSPDLEEKHRIGKGRDRVLYKNRLGNCKISF